MNRIQVSGWLVIATLMTNFFFCPLNVAWAQPQVRANDLAVTKPVSINKANAEELQAVRGIGPALAERIISYRAANGGFKSLDQLKEVKGIGDAKFEKVKDQITL